MKRRTKDKIGSWPNMRDDTLRAISDELIRARKKYPRRGLHMKLLASYATELNNAIVQHHCERGAAVQVYACAVSVAAMAIRLLEEGDLNYRYTGNTQAPEFKLEAETDGY
jgi:hypothetical protein